MKIAWFAAACRWFVDFLWCSLWRKQTDRFFNQKLTQNCLGIPLVGCHKFNPGSGWHWKTSSEPYLTYPNLAIFTIWGLLWTILHWYQISIHSGRYNFVTGEQVSTPKTGTVRNCQLNAMTYLFRVIPLFHVLYWRHVCANSHFKRLKICCSHASSSWILLATRPKFGSFVGRIASMDCHLHTKKNTFLLYKDIASHSRPLYPLVF